MSLKNGTLFIGKKSLDNIQIGVIYEYKEYIFSSNSCYCAKLVDRDELEIIIDGTKKQTETKVQELVDNGVLEVYKEEVEPKTCIGCINSDICKYKNTVAKVELQLDEDIKEAGVSLQLICNRKEASAPKPVFSYPYVSGVGCCTHWDSSCPNFKEGRCLSQLGCTRDITFTKCE